MNIRKLKKLIKTEKLSNYQNSLLVEKLMQLNHKYGTVVNTAIINISKKLNLYIEDPNKIEPNSFVVNLDFRDIFFVEKIDRGCMIYYRAYTIEGGIWYSESGKVIRKEVAYGFCDGEPHGGCCTLTDNYRKALASEILRLPKEGILTEF